VSVLRDKVAVPSRRGMIYTRPFSGVVRGFAHLGEQMVFHVRSIGAIGRVLRHYRAEVVRLVAEVSLGSGALAVIGGTVVVVGFLTAAAGYEVGQQGNSSLGHVGIGALAGFISAYFNTREAVPAVTAIALTATVGAGFTAQLGAMRVSDEIDALEAMSIPSLPYLVTTRILAGLIAVIPLYALALIMGFTSTRIVTVWISGEARGTYEHYFNVFLSPSDVFWSLVKVLIMAVCIMAVTCYYGYTASGGPAGVGIAVGRGVRTSLIAVMIIDLLVGIAVFGGPGAGVRLSG
jgi:phospholipid/cholesterol/gamma-HCH transport system permease protein